MWVNRSASLSPGAGAKASRYMQASGNLEGHLSKLASQMWLGGDLLCGQFYLCGPTTPLVGSAQGLHAPASHTRSFPTSLQKVSLHAQYVPQMPHSIAHMLKFPRLCGLPATQSGGPWGQWAGGLEAWPRLPGLSRSPSGHSSPFPDGSLSERKVTLALSWKENNCWGKVFSG